MKYGYAGIAMIAFGLLGLVIILMFEFITVDNESEYYTLKEALKASMIESVDLACYRNNNGNQASIVQKVDENGVETIEPSDESDFMFGCDGKLKISEQKVVENFTKRFAASVNGDVDDYTIEFFDIIESPPKVSVIVRSRNSNFRGVFGKQDDSNGDIYISNDLTGILETYYN